ncbi:MAG: lipoprotein, partial [Pseudomonadota bacterium]
MRPHPMWAALLLGLPALADDLDQVRARAACADQALDAALGEGEVSPACAGTLAQPVPVAVIGVDGLATSTGGFADVQRTIDKPAKKQPQPTWVTSPPYEPGKLYGVGKGATSLEAFQKALVMVAAQLEAEIDAETRTSQTAETVLNKRGRVVSMTSTNRVDAVSQLLVKGVVEDVQLVGQWVDKDGAVWVLAGLDTAAIAAREDAVVRQVLGLLADATERVRVGLSAEVLDQRVLFGLADAIRQVRALGRAKVGEDASAQWKSELRDFQDLAEDVANCVEIDGVIVAGGAAQPIGTSPVVRPGDHADLTVTCRGKPLANARFRTRVQGGMAQIPGRVVTDAAGRVSLPFGEVFGSNVVVGLVHDVPGQSGSWWLDALAPARTARLGVAAPRAATVQLDVSGGSADENAQVAGMVAQAVASQWGATVVPSGGLLTVKGKLATGT